MYFKTETTEYRSAGNGWQERTLGTKVWKSVAKKMWQKIYDLRKDVIGNRRPTIAETCRVRLSKNYNEQTKKTTKFAYKYGVDLDRIIT